MGIYRRHVTASEFSECKPSYDMKIASLADGTKWACINWLNIQSQDVVFASDAEVSNCTLPNRFSRMGLVDKMASSLVSVTNLAPAINGSTGFSQGGTYSYNPMDGWQKYSPKSLYLTQAMSSNSETTSQSTTAAIPLVQGNKYYIRYEIKQPAKVGSTQFFLGGDTVGGSVTASGSALSSVPVSAANTWTLVSTIFTSPHPTGNHKFRFDFDHNKTAGGMHFDGLVIVDLTKDFSAGKEPSKAWCDANLTYFTGTKTIDAVDTGYKRWEFLLRYPDISATAYNRWSQTSSPNVAYGQGTGYTPISIAWTANSANYPLTKAYSSYSGSAVYATNMSSSWWSCVGPKAQHNNGIPAASGGISHNMELWVRIDNLAPSQQARIYHNNNMIGNHIYEW